MTPQSHEAGFTLAEMLVSLALLAIAASLLVAGAAASRGAWRRLEAKKAAGESVSAAQARLRQSLEQMVVRARFERDPPYVDLSGDSESFTFLSAPPAGEPPGPAVNRTLKLDDRGELELGRQWPYPLAPDEVLLKGVSRLEIAYWAAGGGAAAGWRGDWSRQPRPPELVRVRVAFPPGDRRAWPEMVVRPAAMVDVQCVVDGDTGACRGRA